MGACRIALVMGLSMCMEVAVRAIRPSASASVRDDPPVPKFPESLTVSYTFSLPYTAKLQPHPVSYPVVFYRDAENKLVRMSTYGDTNTYISRKGRQYQLTPRVDKLQCRVHSSDDGGLLDSHPLPDLTGWEYGGVEEVGGRQAHLWVYSKRHQAKQTVYRFWAALGEGPGGGALPLRLHLHGEMWDGAHFDEWVVDYTDYSPGAPDASVFEEPKLCTGMQPDAAGSGAGRAAALRMRALVPGVAYGGDAAYDAFLLAHGAGRAHRSLAEYRLRAAVHADNAAYIEAHNADASKPYRLAMNKWGDWTHEEFLEAMLPKRRRRLAAAGNAAPLQRKDPRGAHQLDYRPLLNASRVPAALSWRGTPGDGPVKDQADCGSCWTFGATGAMQAAWWAATGQAVSFSEQQILDCSWGTIPEKPESNTACDGGDSWAGVEYVVQAGGILRTEDYEYRGQEGYCTADVAGGRRGVFSGYARLPHDDAAVKEALASRGPLAIGIDASHRSFTYYSSGVYFEEACARKSADLDHAVTLVGYGTGPEGDFWEVKNTWSTNWGDGGYIRVTRDRGGCGVPADALYAVVDMSAL